MLLTIIVTIIFLTVTAYLGYIGYKGTKNSQDYMVAGRQIHPVIMALSYGATFISTSAIVGFGGVAGQLGMGVLWLTFLNILIGVFIAFVLFGKRTRKMGHNVDAHTFPELLGVRYDSKFIQGFTGLIIFVFMPIYAAAVLKGGVEFIQTHFGIPFEVSLFCFAAIVALYVSMGGMKGVMYTDAFQGIIMFVGMILLLVFTYAKLGGVTEAHTSLTELFNRPEVQVQPEVANLVKGGFQGWTSMPEAGTSIWWSLVSSIVLGVGIGVLSQPQLTVRFMTVKSNRELNRAVVSGGIFILMMTGVAFVVGALTNVIFFEDTGKVAIAVGVDSVIPEYIKRYMPEWFGSIFLVSMLSAAMSTLSSQFHVMGTSIGRDFYEKALGKKGNSILITRTGMLLVILLSTLLAWLSSKLSISVGIIARGTSLFFGLTAASFLPAYIGALYSKTIPKAAAIWGMVSGFIVSFFWIFFINATNAKAFQICKLIFGKENLVQGTGLESLSRVDAVVIGLPISIIVTLVVWGIYMAKKKQDISKAHIDKCFEGI